MQNLLTPSTCGNCYSRVEPGRIGHLHTHFIRQSDQVANNYYMLKQGTLLFATVHKLTGLIIVLRLLVQVGWIGQREGFIRLPGDSSDSSFFLKILSNKQNITNPTQRKPIYFNLTRWQHKKITFKI